MFEIRRRAPVRQAFVRQSAHTTCIRNSSHESRFLFFSAIHIMNSCLWLSRRILHLRLTLVCAAPFYFCWIFCNYVSVSANSPFRYCVAYNRLFGGTHNTNANIPQMHYTHQLMFHFPQSTIKHFGGQQRAQQPLQIHTVRIRWLSIWRFCAHKENKHRFQCMVGAKGNAGKSHLIYTVLRDYGRTVAGPLRSKVK